MCRSPCIYYTFSNDTFCQDITDEMHVHDDTHTTPHLVDFIAGVVHLPLALVHHVCSQAAEGGFSVQRLATLLPLTLSISAA
jgi:hypothetical protein